MRQCSKEIRMKRKEYSEINQEIMRGINNGWDKKEVFHNSITVHNQLVNYKRSPGRRSQIRKLKVVMISYYHHKSFKAELVLLGERKSQHTKTKFYCVSSVRKVIMSHMLLVSIVSSPFDDLLPNNRHLDYTNKTSMRINVLNSLCKELLH